MYKIKPLSLETMQDYIHFFDKTFEDSFVCYCVMWQMTDIEMRKMFNEPVKHNLIKPRECMRNIAIEQIECGVLNGYLAYEGENPIAWCNAGDKNSYKFLGRHMQGGHSKEELSLRIKSIVCINVPPEHQHKGVATELIKYICENAKESGYNMVEAYPNSHSCLSDSSFTFLCDLYKKVGFEIIEDNGTSFIMRKIL